MSKTQMPLVNKVFLILETLAATREPMPMFRIAARTGIPRPTVHRLLHHMREMGYVGYDDRVNSWYPGLRLAQLQPRGDYEALRQAALPKMNKLFRQFDETVNLGVLTGGRVHYIMSLETSKPLRWVVHPHQTDDFHSTALGRAIVAHLPSLERESILGSDKLLKHTGKTITSKGDLRKMLNCIRQRGWAKEDGENDGDVLCLGVPLLSDGYPLGSVSISVPRIRVGADFEKKAVAALLSIREL
jgi:DNA-binding IclR family transcriptional regulator